MVCNVITADKANRLFWLGRYAERVYISLHLLRRYYDKAIDGNMSDLNEYYRCLGGYGAYGDDEESKLAQLYDKENNFSIITSLDRANDNAIVLRHDITSESLSYIQMSQVLLDDCASVGENNITLLQPITDYMLAFFGSVDERVFNKRIRKYLKIGKMIENLDLHVRFNYPFFRIEEVYDTLKTYIKQIDVEVNESSLARLDEMIQDEVYNPASEQYKDSVVRSLNSLVLV
ncbi:MAG: alpha-E domain-containing protein [Rikenellaceae bacterium]